MLRQPHRLVQPKQPVVQWTKFCSSATKFWPKPSFETASPLDFVESDRQYGCNSSVNTFTSLMNIPHPCIHAKNSKRTSGFSQPDLRRRMYSSCCDCQRQCASRLQPEMSLLPTCRFPSDKLLLLQQTGPDFLGPFALSNSTTYIKQYGLLHDDSRCSSTNVS